MKRNKGNVPKIRFPGFTDEWEPRKLREVIEDYIEKTIVQNQYPVLTSSQQKGIIFQEEYFAGRQTTTDDNIGYFILPKGYFTYRSRSDNDIFIFNRNDLINKGIISYFYPVFQVKDVDSDFFLRRVNNGLQKEIIIAAEGTGQHVLSLKKFKNIIAMFPSEEEQSKIGKFFADLDNLITLHQRKLTHLQAQKKGLLQKMFPKEGERFPELRFPGFAEAWEVRKLGEVAEFSKGSGYSKDDLIDTGIPIILYGRLYTQYQTQIEEVNTFVKEKKYSVYSTGKEVIVPASGETAEDISIASAVIKSGILLGGDLNIIYPSSKLDSSFLALQISNGNAKKKLSRRAQGKSVVHLHNVDLQKVGIIFPSIHEQKEISEFLTNFDNLITLHQRKLTHLRQQKKALLQQMFV